ncbi:sigma-54-dependent Fis family transcriptional regulator [Pontibacter diazotrophicus]|uniref:Sigma-54-dependent Fis family transcriptional regulator n=1 Tax=Pontibacter diazotrophicus TaxID=1400979 RepID=A0A3D8LG17_9BACT|nr:sigma-54 dependent transcriptional regulator [Pontibacter diazotrophicus]RDV16355.1 sigma-54-dependent Fis family transcriptional regulator [Pontibacter diazotrophicus]
MRNIDIQSIKQRFGIIGNSHLLNHAIQVAVQVAPTDMTVLITGESGSGKESFSKIIHQLSPRKHGQFIAINCGAIPEGTIDSELFGHEKGSFTGAQEARKGYFEVTDGGTIFLDEIGEMPLGTQARLLRVLENGEFIKVGSSKVQKTDVRVVAATNVNLIRAVENGRFREDLYYRLNTVPITVPSLRERGDDIYLLFRKFAADFSEKYKVKPITLTPDAVHELIRFPFPGNIRQLKNMVEQISVLEYDREVDGQKMRQYLPQEQVKSNLPAVLAKEQSGEHNYSERDLLYKVLFDMRRDVSELKKLVFDMITTHQPNEEELLKEHGHLFENIEQYNGNGRSYQPQEPLHKEPYYLPVNRAQVQEYEEQKVEDIPHEYEEESLSLENKEKELILKALKKHNNKRKYAAQDLGISERTLYRKLKQYDIED